MRSTLKTWLLDRALDLRRHAGWAEEPIPLRHHQLRIAKLDSRRHVRNAVGALGSKTASARAVFAST
jgi:hypothetical protein